MLQKELTSRIIGCFYEVFSTLGYGFLEKTYENAMMIELRRQGLSCQQQIPIEVLYTGEIIGDYYADILVENSVILELKAAKAIAEEHEAQLINYLMATSIEVGLLLNFGTKPQMVRKIFTNDRKKALHCYKPPENTEEK